MRAGCCWPGRARRSTAKTRARPGFSGSVVIAQFDALEQAQAWADADPYVAAGVYTRVQVRPFRKVLP